MFNRINNILEAGGAYDLTTKVRTLVFFVAIPIGLIAAIFFDLV